jgi:hypothetical protein
MVQDDALKVHLRRCSQEVFAHETTKTLERVVMRDKESSAGLCLQLVRK